MPRPYKYYSASEMLGVSENFNLKYNNGRWIRQFKVVCKARSRAEANRIMEALGCGKDFFRPGYTNETGNDTQIDAADMYGVAFCATGTQGNFYVPITERNI